MDYLDLKDSACANQLDCVISYFFQLYLMLHACFGNFYGIHPIEFSKTCMEH